LQRFLQLFLLSQVFILGLASAYEADIQPFLKQYCVKCHGADKVKGKVDFSTIQTDADAAAQFELWETVVEVLEFAEMPPEDEPQPNDEEREMVLNWYGKRFTDEVEALPGNFRPRRLSALEYRNTLHSLFGFELEVNIMEAEQTETERSLVIKLLPTEPPGASGFVNDTHGAPLSAVLWDQYSYLADVALERWVNDDLSIEQAETMIREFVPRALRRPVSEHQMANILESIADKDGEALSAAVRNELKVVLMSPAFMYRGLLMEGEPGQQPVDDFELAERLSYFLWEDMPDAELMQLAGEGTLAESGVLARQLDRMLDSPKARSLAESFGVQWLGLDQIDEAFSDANQRETMKSQPIDFLDYLFTENRPVMELVDSKTAFANYLTAKYYGNDRKQIQRHIKPKGVEQQVAPNQKIVLEHAHDRGGILTIPGVLAMNHGPILRGTWMLRAILGEHLGEPPADVPPIKPSPPGQELTFRERFEQHRSNVACARCHQKIDPLGFALQAYSDDGAFRPSAEIDTSGKLPSGETFQDYAELKAILLTNQREAIIRNAVERTMSYALCRKLELHDQPAVKAITQTIHESDGTWRDLFFEVVTSLPFRETMIISQKD
tara:strand:- start:1113 stop:2945 length:1833 start_codon:yes stop_codon:yes gene_type:complete